MGTTTTAPEPPTPFTDNTGEASKTPTAYPVAPYGYDVGAVIPPFAFYGFPNAIANNSTMKPIYLSDFYNPHATDATYKPASAAEDDRLFPASSGYKLAGQPKPTVLLIDIASVWCGPCNVEAGTLLPFKHSMYAPCGGEFLLNLHDSAQPGTTATQLNLKNWTKLYKVDYPAAIDPEYKLDPLFSADAFPNNMIIDTTTMKIVHVVAGEVIPGQCNYPDTGMACTQASDCMSQQCVAGTTGTVCGDTLCGTTSDLATCNGTGGFNCNGLAGCNNMLSCSQYDFWTIFESHLDKTRTGCTIK
jgi:hypothetical protein